MEMHIWNIDKSTLYIEMVQTSDAIVFVSSEISVVVVVVAVVVIFA